MNAVGGFLQQDLLSSGDGDMNGRAYIRSIMASTALTLGLAVAPLAQAQQPTPANNIVDVAVALNSSGPFAGAFDTLITAVLAADPAVLARLTSKRQSTVFAPTDDAFAALGLTPQNVGSLPQDFLTDVLAYHVLNGSRDSGEVIESTRLKTTQGGFLRQAGGVLTDNLGREAAIKVTDVGASNGIIHVIDGVVLPYAP
jgi:uncharacterized surface protein with fasciclin (FAS1) repeats